MNKFTKILYQVRLLNILKVKVIENSIIIDLRKPVPSGLLEHKVFFKLKSSTLIVCFFSGTPFLSM